MSVLKSWFFILIVLIGSSVYTLQRIGVVLPVFVNNYLNDILSIPIVLSIILIVVRLIRGNSFQLSLWMIISVVLYFSFYFEYYIPQFNPRYTADILDVGCYLLGGITFYFAQRYCIPT